MALVALAYLIGTQSADAVRSWRSGSRVNEYRTQAASQTAAVLRHMGTIKVGDTLGDFALEDIDSNLHRLSELVGRVRPHGESVPHSSAVGTTAEGDSLVPHSSAVGAVAGSQSCDLTMITYMKPDCDACLDESEHLRSFVGRVRFEPAGGEDIYDHVILITSANPLHMHRVREDYGLGCVILYDDERTFGAALRIEAFPFNLVVGRDRVIREIHANVLLPEDYERLFGTDTVPHSSAVGSVL